MNDLSQSLPASDADPTSRPDSEPSDGNLHGADAPNAQLQPSESIIRHYWRILLKRRWVIAGAIVAFLFIGILIIILSQRLYASTATLEINRETARIIEVQEVQPRPSFDPEFYQTQYELLKSRSLAEMVVRDLRLAQDEAFLTDYEGDSEGTLASLSREERESRAVNKVLANLRVLPVRLSSVVNVQYISPSPQMAARVANSLVENFIEQDLARRLDSSSFAKRFLERRLGEMRQRLEESERQATTYAAQQQIINIAPSSRDPSARPQEQPLVVADLSATNAALADARTARIAAEARFRQARQGMAAQEALQNPAVNTLRQQRAQLSGEYQQRLNQFGPEYPTVLAARAQIVELDRQIATETGRIQTGVSQNLQALYRQALEAEQQLSGNVERLKAELVDLRRRSIQYNIYQRDVDTNRGLYDALLQRYKEIGITGGVGANNISIIDRATTPLSPFRPNIILTLLASLLIGSALGAGAALVLEQLDEATIAPDDFQNKLGIPLLGATPKLDKGQTAEEALADRKSPLSEAYLSVLTGLQFSTAHGMPKSLLVTSSQASEGKSTTSFALAQSLARVGSRVLIIDADLRNPTLHKSQGLSNKAGLSSLLVGEGKLDQLVQPTSSERLFALTAGRIPPNPAELLTGPGMEEVIAEARRHYDHVIIDGPPVLGLADAPLLARAVEATVFILEAGRTRATQARHALARMTAIQARIAGAVLTKFDQQKFGYGYGYGYDYDYGS